MSTANIIPARLALLCDPANPVISVGPDAIEGLLTTWLKTPIALGHREDASPYLIGVEGKHVSLRHDRGISAIAVAGAPVGIGLVPVLTNATDHKASLKLLGASERAWLNALPRGNQPAVFALMMATLEAQLRQIIESPVLNVPPAGRSSMKQFWEQLPAGAIGWRPWLSLTGSDRIAAGLLLGAPAEVLTRFADGTASCALIETPNGPFALAVAWTAPKS